MAHLPSRHPLGINYHWVDVVGLPTPNSRAGHKAGGFAYWLSLTDRRSLTSLNWWYFFVLNIPLAEICRSNIPILYLDFEVFNYMYIKLTRWCGVQNPQIQWCNLLPFFQFHSPESTALCRIQWPKTNYTPHCKQFAMKVDHFYWYHLIGKTSKIDSFCSEFVSGQN